MPRDLGSDRNGHESGTNDFIADIEDFKSSSLTAYEQSHTDPAGGG